MKGVQFVDSFNFLLYLMQGYERIMRDSGGVQEFHNGVFLKKDARHLYKRLENQTLAAPEKVLPLVLAHGP
jgi:hypothetical protein